MGDVWEANDDVLSRTVAIKVMRPTTDGEPVFARRFRDEALFTANLCHPNVATVYDYGEEDQLAYLVMGSCRESRSRRSSSAKVLSTRPGCARSWGRRPLPSAPRTRRAWSTATSSPRTSWSPRTGW